MCTGPLSNVELVDMQPADHNALVVQDTSFVELHKGSNLSRLYQCDLYASKCNDYVFGESGFEYVQRFGFPFAF